MRIHISCFDFQVENITQKNGCNVLVLLISWCNNIQFQVVTAGANPIQISRGIELTTKALVAELKTMSKEVS